MQKQRSISLFTCLPLSSVVAASLLLISTRMVAFAQQPAQATESSAAQPPVVPQQVRYAGTLPSRAGDTVEALFRIYTSAKGGEPLWTERSASRSAPTAHSPSSWAS